MALTVGVAGATGWVGRPIAEAVLAAQDMDLACAVSRSHAGSDLGVAWGGDPHGIPVYGRVEEALAGLDVLVDVTSHESALANALVAIDHGVAVVIGASGLTAQDFATIDAAAQAEGVGVVAAGNFSLTAAMAQAAALLVAPYLPQREVIDYASATKPDAPSGTARELADRLAQVADAEIAIPVAATSGAVEARGAPIGGTQVHSVRLPSFVVSTEVIFGLPDERLSIRHDAGASPAPYVAGALVAIRAVLNGPGLTRGLDSVLLAG